jgi:hypothetical protein
MASPEKKRNPVIALEDWWTVWFGLVIVVIATGLAIAHYSADMPLKKVPKLGVGCRARSASSTAPRRPGSR